jgi:mannose-6-phosphate isomerase-like protein (cupin superfamily)
MNNNTHDTHGQRIVIHPDEFGRGAPMEVGQSGVRDLKVIYPETGFQAKSLCFGIVEIDPGEHSPLHRHNCEEMYYVLDGESAEVEVDGELFPCSKGDSVLITENRDHRMHNRGNDTVRLAVVAGMMFVPLWPEWPTDSPYEILE